MSAQTAISLFRNEEKAKWNKPNKMRGREYVSVAIAFYEKFPIGTQFITDEFVEWAISKEYLPAPVTREKQSNEWKGYLHAIADLRQNINKASTRQDFPTPYAIRKSRAAKKGWETVSIVQAIAENNIAERTASFVECQKTTVRYYMEGGVMEMKEVEREMAQGLWDQLETFEMFTKGQKKIIDNSLKRFLDRLNRPPLPALEG
jgi:hypothetical protein